MSASFIPKSVDNVHATLLQKIKIPKGKSNKYNITSCAIFSNGKVIFADCDNNMRLVILNTDGSFNYEFPFSKLRPYSVACIDDMTIAFSVWNSSEIYLYDIKSKIMKNSIKTNNICFGVAHRDGILYYCSKDSVAQIKDGISSTIVNLGYALRGWRNIASFGEFIYLTNNTNNSVLCFNVQGRKLWEYKDDEIIRSPSGIAVDKYGIVYVALKEKQCIVALSPDGKQVMDFLSCKECIENPLKLVYDNKRDLLLVASYDGNCAVFEIRQT
ncbi:unnamed protein product [Mytilus coruscus]|uniref:Uncharacterized protein n=1 Tax=Mytilus coruscus TaxID=42192 RepID=A0A6J8DSL9_MYTCO|nr:unnamed protein product [Mytilus coruscus]